MKRVAFWTTVFAIFGTLISFSSIAGELPTQANSDLPLNDQARYLQNLENRSASQWSFSAPDRAKTTSQYTLSLSKPEVRLTEQKPPEWRNSGDDPNYSLLIDIDRFTDEFIEPQ